jgi:hypothetical protein
MRRSTVGCLIGAFAVLAIPVMLGVLEYGRVSRLCRGMDARVENAHEAISAVRNYRGPFDFPDVLLKLRQLEPFQSDDFGNNGGWLVEERTNLVEHKYTVEFTLIEPRVSITCDVFECGAVDQGNCRVSPYGL